MEDEIVSIAVGVDFDRRTFRVLAPQQFGGQRILDRLLDHSLHGTSPERRVVAQRRDPLPRRPSGIEAMRVLVRDGRDVGH